MYDDIDRFARFLQDMIAIHYDDVDWDALPDPEPYTANINETDDLTA